MTNELQIFQSEDFGSVRTLYRDDEPWFVAADVCKSLGIENARQAITRLDDDEKDAVILNDTMGRQQTVNIINEFGLYNLILGSRKPEAKQFKRWITHEVIPQIRQTGAYQADNRDDDLPLTDSLSEYLHAARSIAMASDAARPLVRSLLQKAGIDTTPALPQKTPDTFRARLKVTIEALGLDAADAAQVVGVSLDLMQRYLRGKYTPSQVIQDRIFGALENYNE